jgi:hypothetical protein
MKRIPDLHYVVIKCRTFFARAGHATVFYRHDKDGRRFICHVANHYGEDGRDTRARARRHGRDIVTRKLSIGYRNLTDAAMIAPPSGLPGLIPTTRIRGL